VICPRKNTRLEIVHRIKIAPGRPNPEVPRKRGLPHGGVDNLFSVFL